MGSVRFTQHQIDRFNDRIKNCLEDSRCRNIFRQYLSRNPVLLNALKLWEEANGSNEFDEDKFLDLIDEVEDFNQNPLLTLSECEHKLAYVKMETCRILEKIRPYFIQYLSSHHS